MLADRRALAVAVFLAAVAAYGASLAGILLFDDLHAIRDNQSIRSLSSIPSFFWDVDAFSSLEMRMYRPLLLVTLALNSAMGGGEPWAFKLTNVLLHGWCAVLVFANARRLRVAAAPAAWVGALFAVHPMASETINLVSSRSDQLVVLGALLAMYFHYGAMRGRQLAILGTALATALACGGKETGVAVPGCLLSLELVRYARSRQIDLSGVAKRVLPAIAVAVVYLLIRRELFGVATFHLPKMTGGADALNGAGRDLVTQFGVMAHVLPKFTAQSFLPLGLTMDPFVPLQSRPWSFPVLAGWVLIGLGTWHGLRAPRRRPAAFIGTCLAWGIALPWVIVPLNMPACEHRFYGPLAGLALVVACWLNAGWVRKPSVRIGLAALLLVYGGWSTHRSLQFRDPLVLWNDCLALDPHSVRGLCGRALAQRDAAYAAAQDGDQEQFVERMQLAIRDVEQVVAAQPLFGPARRNLVEFNLQLGEHGDALSAVYTAEVQVERAPDDPFAWLLLCRARLAVAERCRELPLAARLFDSAEAAALQCLEIAEPKGLVFRHAATVRRSQGNFAAALAHLDRSVGQGLDHSSVLFDRCEVLLELGRVADARRDLSAAMATDPMAPRARELIQRLQSFAAPR